MILKVNNQKYVSFNDTNFDFKESELGIRSSYSFLYLTEKNLFDHNKFSNINSNLYNYNSKFDERFDEKNVFGIFEIKPCKIVSNIYGYPSYEFGVFKANLKINDRFEEINCESNYKEKFKFIFNFENEKLYVEEIKLGMIYIFISRIFFKLNSKDFYRLKG